jgi:hypothetical protein
MTFAATARLAGKRGLSPNDISGLVGWWEAETIAGADGDAIGTWVDRKGIRNLTASGGARPQLKIGVTPSGANALRFDGSDDNMAATVLAQRTFSVVVCAKITGGDAARIIAYNGSTGASGAGMYATTGNYYNLRGGVGQTAHSSATPDGDWHIYAYQARDLSVDDSNMAVDDTFGAYVSQNFAVPATRFAIMGELDVNNAAGDVAAVLLYDIALGATNFTLLHTYLNNKYLI